MPSSGSGGGLWTNGGTLSVSASTLSGNATGNGNPNAIFNVGGFGGGIGVESGGLTMTNSTLSANATGSGSGLTGFGAGIYVDAGAVTVTNSTIASNTVGAGGSAGAISLIGSSALLINDLFVANSGGECGGSPAPASSHNLSDSGCGSSFTHATAGQINLGTLQDNGGPAPTMALRFPSAAIDAGSDAACPLSDERGMPRPYGAHCDIGAYEFQIALNFLFLPVIRR